MEPIHERSLRERAEARLTANYSVRKFIIKQNKTKKHPHYSRFSYTGGNIWGVCKGGWAWCIRAMRSVVPTPPPPPASPPPPPPPPPSLHQPSGIDTCCGKHRPVDGLNKS